MVAAPRLLAVGPASSPVGKACIAVIGIAGATSLEVLAAEALLSLRPAPPPVAIPRMAIIGHRSRRWGWGGHDATHMELCAAESLLGNRPSVQEMSSGITIEGKSRHGSHVIMRTAHLVVLTAPKFLSQRPNFQRPFVAVVWHGSWRRTAGDTFCRQHQSVFRFDHLATLPSQDSSGGSGSGAVVVAAQPILLCAQQNFFFRGLQR